MDVKRVAAAQEGQIVSEVLELVSGLTDDVRPVHPTAEVERQLRARLVTVRREDKCAGVIRRNPRDVPGQLFPTKPGVIALNGHQVEDQLDRGRDMEDGGESEIPFPPPPQKWRHPQ